MRKLGYAAAACILAMGAGLSAAAHARQTINDEVFANASLRSLHDLAYAVAQHEQAIKDSDELGCHDAYTTMQKDAHEALTDMHSISFAPADAIEDVSRLLRLSQLDQNKCSDGFEKNLLLVVAGQAIMALRYDYSIGDGDWYTVTSGGTIKAKNPLQYAQSLKDQSYSWVSVRPKDMVLMVELDWKAEMASHAVDDPSIENSGDNLNAVEVDYRKNSGDSATTVIFYRTKEDAQAAVQTASRQAEADAKADAELKASKAEWNRKLMALPYLVADHEIGFKLIYDVCRGTDNYAANPWGICADGGSHDGSDSRGAPYHWFSDMRSCEAAQLNIYDKKPADVKMNHGDAFVSACLPAPKMSGQMRRGYEMVFSLVAPGAADDDALYAEWREHGSNDPAVFKTFKECYDASNIATPDKLAPDLGVDEDGNLLSDKTKSIELTANCVRVY